MRVLLTANSSQHGHNLTCRASHPLLAEPLEASLSLNVLCELMILIINDLIPDFHGQKNYRV